MQRISTTKEFSAFQIFVHALRNQITLHYVPYHVTCTSLLAHGTGRVVSNVSGNRW